MLARNVAEAEERLHPAQPLTVVLRALLLQPCLHLSIDDSSLERRSEKGTR